MGKSKAGFEAAGQASLYLIAVAGLAIIVVPFLWVVMISLTPEGLVYRIPVPLVPSEFSWEAYSFVLSKAADFTRLYGNTAILTFSAIAGVLIFGSMAGYSFGRMNYPGRDKIFWGLLISTLIPSGGGIQVLYMLTAKMHLLNTRLGVILPYTAGGAFAAAFVLRGFFMSFPKELEDAAAIDGCGPLQTFTRIFLPLSKNGLVTVAMLQFPGYWGEYLVAYTLISRRDLRPIAVIISQMAPDSAGWSFPQIAAAYILVILPVVILFFVFQKAFIRGFTEGAFKF